MRRRALLHRSLPVQPHQRLFPPRGLGLFAFSFCSRPPSVVGLGLHIPTPTLSASFRRRNVRSDIFLCGRSADPCCSVPSRMA